MSNAGVLKTRARGNVAPRCRRCPLARFMLAGGAAPPPFLCSPYHLHHTTTSTPAIQSQLPRAPSKRTERGAMSTQPEVRRQGRSGCGRGPGQPAALRCQPGGVGKAAQCPAGRPAAPARVSAAARQRSPPTHSSQSIPSPPQSQNVFEVLSREEAAPEVEDPSAVVTQSDVKKGLASTTTADAPPAGGPQPVRCLCSTGAACWLTAAWRGGGGDCRHRHILPSLRSVPTAVGRPRHARPCR